MVRTAQRLFHLRGYNATSIADTLEEAKVGSGSLYYFFKTKDDLLLAVLDWYLENMYPEIIEPAFAKTDDPIERIFQVMDGYRFMLTEYNFAYGCPIGNLAIEAAEGRPVVGEKVAQNFTNWCKAIQGCLDTACARLPKDVDTAALARFILTVMEGRIMQARAHRWIEPYDLCIAQLRDYFNRLMRQGHKTG
jgi:TetR/AcrR family transcriptional repressor of nem operon